MQIVNEEEKLCHERVEDKLKLKLKELSIEFQIDIKDIYG